MVWIVLAGLGLTTGALVLLVEGAQVFAVWNLVPVLLALAACLLGARRFRSAQRSVRSGLAVFCVVTPATVALAHCAWHFDWGATATGSSTAGLLFLFAPVYSMAIGLIAGAIAVAALSFAGRRRPGA